MYIHLDPSLTMIIYSCLILVIIVMSTCIVLLLCKQADLKDTRYVLQTGMCKFDGSCNVPQQFSV